MLSIVSRMAVYLVAYSVGMIGAKKTGAVTVCRTAEKKDVMAGRSVARWVHMKAGKKDAIKAQHLVVQKALYLAAWSVEIMAAGSASTTVDLKVGKTVEEMGAKTAASSV
jgi:hypothetical protein